MQAQVRISDGVILAVGTFPAGSPDPDTIAVVTLTTQQEAAISSPGTKTLNQDGSVTVTPPPPPPEPETPVADILMALLADVSDVDETKPILEAMLVLLGATPPEA